MHSRIFQISSNRITEDDRISESRYEDYFVGSIADYVVQSENVSDDLEWLKSATKGLEIDIKKRTIKIVSKKEYFEEKFEEFKKALDELKDTPLDEFVNTNYDLSSKMFRLKESYEDKYAFYIDDNDEYSGTTPLDTWVRDTEEGKVYHVGNTFDYHF